MWQTIDADGYPAAGTECFVWALGWPKVRIAEAFDCGTRGFSNAGGELDGVTHWSLLEYPALPAAQSKPTRAKARK